MNVKNWTVCVVEPNKFEGQIILDLLRNFGVDRVKLAASPQEAVEMLEVYGANIVIASYEMTPMDGAAWTRAFRRNLKLANRKASIFITSSAFSRAMAEECRHAGANALIGKPTSAKVLTATITKVLAQPREFIDAENGYVGPCRRAGIVTAGAPKKRRQADEPAQAAPPVAALASAIQALMSAAAAFAEDSSKADACDAALRQVQACAVNAGDGPLMRACAAFALQISSFKSLRPDAARAALDACVSGVSELAAMSGADPGKREAVAEGVRQAVAKAAMQRAA